MGKGKLKVHFLSFSLPLKLTEFNFFLAFFQGVSLDTQSRRRKDILHGRAFSHVGGPRLAQKLNVGEDSITVR